MKQLFIILILSIQLFAGRYGDAFIQASLPASAVSLGNAGVTQLTGIQSVLTNPAGISQFNGVEAYAQYSGLFGLGYQHSMGIKTNYNKNLHIALSWHRLGVDNIPIHPDLLDSLSFVERRNYLRNTSSGDWDVFSDREDAFYVSLAKKYTHKIKMGWAYDEMQIVNPVGVNIKFLHKSIFDNSALGVGIDFGTKFIIPGKDIFYIRNLGDFIFAINIENIYGTGLYWDSGHVDVIWMSARAGIALRQPLKKYNSEILLIYERGQYRGEKNKLGMKVTIAQSVVARLGSDQEDWFAGIGLIFNYLNHSINLDYAFQKHSLDPAHRITLSMDF